MYFKTQKYFSAIARDQCHEQNNAMVKGDGGAIGLTENPVALARWMLAGPEVAHVVQEFEEAAKVGQSDGTTLHHEQTKRTQDYFIKDVRQLIAAFEDMGNPFLDESEGLLTLDRHEITDKEIVRTVREAENIGTKQYANFVQQRFIDRSVSVFDPIPSNKLSLFHSPTLCKRNPSLLAVQSLKSDRELFSRLFISCQTRGGDLETFFHYENQAAPPSLSEYGKQQRADKISLLPSLEAMVQDNAVFEMCPDVSIIEGSVMVHFLLPDGCRTFNDYAEREVMPYIKKELETVHRVDIVWDTYTEHNLKAVTREWSGKGRPRRVTGGRELPGSWQNFFRNDNNKTELFHFLPTKCKNMSIPDGKQVYLTLEDEVIAVPEVDIALLSPCSHEEADTRVILHVLDAVKSGFRRISIRTNDTDVMVLSICFSQEIEGLEELWVQFGVGKSKRSIPCPAIGSALGQEKSRALLFFHSFTGCDTVSSFFNHSKKSAFMT